MDAQKFNLNSKIWIVERNIYFYISFLDFIKMDFKSNMFPKNMQNSWNYLLMLPI